MHIVPVLRVSNLSRSAHFYTVTLDFRRRYPAPRNGQEQAEEEHLGVLDLTLSGAEIQLSRHTGDGCYGSVVRIYVPSVDERYQTFRARGLDTTQHSESPVHTAPVDQTWGLREFSVKDPDGNSLLFCAPLITP